MTRNIIVVLLLFSLVLSSFGLSVPKAFAWKMLVYQTCRGYDSKTGACIDPTSTFTNLDPEVWLHSEFDLSDIPSSVKFNTITEWRDPTGYLYQRANYTWSGGSHDYWSNRGMPIAGTGAASLPGNWTVKFILDGDQIGHNLLAFTTWFVIVTCLFCSQQTTTTPSDVDSKGYVIGANLYARYAYNAPNVSTGVLKLEQWKDASITKMLSASNTQAYLLLQHDDKGVYFGIDVPTQKKIDVIGNVVGNCCQDVIGLIFDTKHIGFDGSTYAANPHIRVIGGQLYFANVAYDQYVQKINKYSYSSTPLDNVVLAASISPSPIISGDSSHGYAMTGQYTSDGNLMWTGFIPNEVLEYNASTPLLDSIGCRLDIRMSDSPYLVEYPRDYLFVNGKIADRMMPIADLTFSPQVTTVVTTLTSTRTVPITSTTTRVVTTTEIRETVPIAMWGTLVVALVALVGIGAVAYLHMRRRTKEG